VLLCTEIGQEIINMSENYYTMFDIVFADFDPRNNTREVQRIIKNRAIHTSKTSRREVEIIIAGSNTDIIGDVRINVNRCDVSLVDLVELLNQTGNEFLTESVAKYTLRNL
jgi:hypothetical protein